MGRQDDDGGAKTPQDEVSIPGEEDSPFWIDHDPFLARRDISPPNVKKKAPKETAVALSSRDDTSKTSSPSAPPRTLSGDTEAHATTEPSPPRAKALPKVSIDPRLLAETRKETPKTRHPTTSKRKNSAPSSPSDAPHDPQASSGHPKDPPSKPTTKPVESSPSPQDRQASDRAEGAPSRRGEDPPPSRSDDGARPPRRRRRRLFFPLWLWILIAIIGLGALLLVIDLRKPQRFRLFCKDKRLTIQEANRFPWPFGFSPLSGPLRPIVVFDESTCITQHFQSREEVEEAFLTFVLRQVRTALADPAQANLTELQAELEQGRRLSAKEAHLGRAKEIKLLLADVAYRGARMRLARVELTLREALALFQKARTLGQERYEDLDDWITYIDQLLKRIAPSPRASSSSSLVAPPPPTRIRSSQAPEKTRSPSVGTSAPLAPPATQAPPLIPGSPPHARDAAPAPRDAAPTPRDASPPPTGSGILL